jgi:hypothetical protein
MTDELYFCKGIIQFSQTGKEAIFFPTGTSDSRIVLCGIYYNIYFNKKNLKMSKG